MENKEGKTDNELIAEFMGAERREGPRAFNPDQKLIQYIIKGNPYNQHRDDIKHWYQPEELKYHESWDWLMPVVEKIENLEFVTKSEYNLRTHWFSIWAESADTSHCITSQGNGNRIENHYRAVVEFIKWYSNGK